VGARALAAFVPLAVLSVLWAAGCASFVAPPPGAPERARAARAYSASLRVSLKSKDLRGRTRALVAFSRPDKLRIEIPGPMGARCVAVADDQSLVAVFPGDRGVWQGSATAEEMEALLGVRLSPAELMDLLVGSPPPGIGYRASWGSDHPVRFEATLADGSRLDAVVESADLDPEVAAAAFELPRSDGYRKVDAAEARRLLGIR
jgi:hypothetical protein